MRRHNFIQKKVIEYVTNFYINNIESKASLEEKEDWENFFQEISNFDTYDNYIDQLIKDNDKVVVLQYYYSHVDNDGVVSTLKSVSEGNVWIKDNMKYYKDIEKLMKPYLITEIEGEQDAK